METKAPTPNSASSVYVWYAGSDRPASAEELEVLRLSNEVRAKGAFCEAYEAKDGKPGKPATHYGPTPALKLNKELSHAARNHAQDMATRNYFAHNTPEGVRPQDRVSLAGYAWEKTGENLVAGYDTPQKAVDAWLKSPEHCHTLMNPAYKELGVGFYKDPDPNDHYIGGTYWVQEFGLPATLTITWQ